MSYTSFQLLPERGSDELDKVAGTDPLGNDYLFRTDGLARTEQLGLFHPDTLADAAAPVNTVYFSSTQSKLVYKDAGSVVHALHE